jgi:hypothetical protein
LARLQDVYKTEFQSGKTLTQSVMISLVENHGEENKTVFYTIEQILESTQEVYLVSNDRVQLIATQNILGQIQIFSYDILRLPGETWEVEDRGDIYKFRTENTPLTVKDITYNVIGVEKNIFIKRIVIFNRIFILCQRHRLDYGRNHEF